MFRFAGCCVYTHVTHISRLRTGFKKMLSDKLNSLKLAVNLCFCKSKFDNLRINWNRSLELTEPIPTICYSVNTQYKTLSQLNDTNAVQKWSFSKCRFSTCMGSKIKGKHVYGDVIVLFLQKIVGGAPGRPRGA